MGHYLLKSDG